ncbi:class A beta-lactamase [Bordetella genomosp. 8]|nr:class A beta-lactamase [Bordetella genomosp. 8]
MTPSLLRRKLLIGLPLLAGMGAIRDVHAAGSALADIERRNGGRLGVFAVDTATGRTLAHRADERFLMCSTFKGLLAAQVLQRVDGGAERLDRLVRYTEKDLIFTSPVTKANVGRGSMSIEELCRAVLVESDNTAAILLMRSAGGPAGLTRFVRGLGDTVTRSDRYEPDSNRADGAFDTTSPKAIATVAQGLLLGDVLSTNSRATLERGMADCKPGLNRIRAALPADWQAADRPGTNIDNETNDYALVRPPGRTPLLVAVYYDAPGVKMDRREAVLREAGKAFVQWATSAA